MLTRLVVCGPFSKSLSVPRIELRLFPAGELAQPACRLIQRLRLLAERKTHLLRTIPRIAIKTGSRDTRHSDLPNQVFGEGHIIAVAKRGNMRHHVIGAARPEAAESCRGTPPRAWRNTRKEGSGQRRPPPAAEPGRPQSESRVLCGWRS